MAAPQWSQCFLVWRAGGQTTNNHHPITIESEESYKFNLESILYTVVQKHRKGISRAILILQAPI